MTIPTTSDTAVLNTVGERLRRERLNQNRTQVDLAQAAGVSLTVIQRLEGGKGCSLKNLVRIMRAIGKLEQFDVFVPEPGTSPIELARLAGRQRQEASGKRGRPRKNGR